MSKRQALNVRQMIQVLHDMDQDATVYVSVVSDEEWTQPVRASSIGTYTDLGIEGHGPGVLIAAAEFPGGEGET